MKITVKGGEIEIPLTGNILARSDEQETIKTFKAYEMVLSKVLIKTPESNEIDVDFEKLENIISAANDRHQLAIRQYVYAVLLVLGILSYRGAYIFSPDYLNPVWGKPDANCSPREEDLVYFVRKPIAKNYGKYVLKDCVEDWYFSRHVEVVTKQKACQ